PDDGITKGDLVDYYLRIAGRMLPQVRDRPLHMNRYPDGIGGIAIQQKRVPESFPPWIRRVTVDLHRGGTITHAVIDNAADPGHLTTEFIKQKREGRLFIDVNRNAYAQTVVAPYAVRARRRAPVAVPVDWRDVERDSLRPDGITIASIWDWMRDHDDPWTLMERARRPIPPVEE